VLSRTPTFLYRLLPAETLGYLIVVVSDSKQVLSQICTQNALGQLATLLRASMEMCDIRQF
jgi:hypothetical protein